MASPRSAMSWVEGEGVFGSSGMVLLSFHLKLFASSIDTCLRQLGTLGMPVRLLLKSARSLDDFSIIERATDELQPHGQAFLCKSARHADGWQPADISDAADRVREAERVVQVGFKLARRDRKRRGGQNINLLAQL